MESLVVTVAAKRIGLGVQSLKREMQAGRSIVEVARSQGVEERALLDTLMAPRLGLLNLGVKSGCHTPRRAEQMRRFMEQRMRSQLHRAGLGHPALPPAAFEASKEGFLPPLRAIRTSYNRAAHDENPSC